MKDLKLTSENIYDLKEKLPKKNFKKIGKYLPLRNKWICDNRLIYQRRKSNILIEAENLIKVNIIPDKMTFYSKSGYNASPIN